MPAKCESIVAETLRHVWARGVNRSQEIQALRRMAWEHGNRCCARVIAVFGIIVTDPCNEDFLRHESVSDCLQFRQSNLGFHRLLKSERREFEDADNESKTTFQSRIDRHHCVRSVAECCTGTGDVPVSNASAHCGTVGACCGRSAATNDCEVPLA